MAPTPSLQELIDTVHQDAPSDDTLDQLATASRTVAALAEVGDDVLGYFVDHARRAGHSWTEISTALGVTKQAVHKRFVATTRAPDLYRLTDRARAVLVAATEVARGFGHPYVGTEHLLLGLFAEPDSIAAKVLTDGGVTREAVEEALLRRTPRRAETPEGSLPYTRRTATVVEGTQAEALRLGHDYIGTEHLLLSLYTEGRGLAVMILGELGLDRDTAQARVVERLIGYRAD